MTQHKMKPTIPERPWPGLPTSAPSIGSQDGGDKYATGDTLRLQMRRKKISIGTWNVRTLNAEGKIQQLTYELQRYSWDIIGISEARLIGSGTLTTDEGHKIYYSGHDKYHKEGTAFIVHKNVSRSIMSYLPVSSRLITIRVSAKPFNITIIEAYAPTSEATEQDIDNFYDSLSLTMKKVPKQDILILVGDFNAKIGVDAYSNWSGTIGKFGLGSTNDRGLRLLEFAKYNGLVVSNTFQPHKLSRKATWHSPDGKTHNMIDYIMINRRHMSSLNLAKTRTYPGADIGSDHDLVLTTLTTRLKKLNGRSKTIIKYDVDKLKNLTIREAFQVEVGGRFAPLLDISNDEDLLEHATTNLKEAADKIIGKKRKTKNPWVTEAVLESCDDRRNKKRERFSSNHKLEEYRLANKNVKKVTKEAKEGWFHQQCIEIENGIQTNNTKTAFGIIKSLTKQSTSSSTCIEDDEGNLVSEPTAVNQRWKQYCQELYNYQLTAEEEVLKELAMCTSKNNDDSPDILESEVVNALKSLKLGKAPGIDNVPADLLVHGGESVVKIYTRICNYVYKTGNWPKDWTKSIVIPLPKKGNLKKCQNYRTISLISHPSKILLKIILNRLQPQAEAILAEEQAGFRKGRSCAEQIFNLRLVCEKYRELGKPVYHTFVDYKKCFDRIWQEGLWAVMRRFNIERGIVNSIAALYEASRSVVLSGGDYSECFPTSVGVRQGCLLSPTLCNIFLENIMRETLDISLKSPVKIAGRPLNHLQFADDVDMIDGSNEDQQNKATSLDYVSRRYGMELSLEKTKTLVSGVQEKVSVNIRGTDLEQVKEFTYLGSVQNEECNSVKEVKVRIAKSTSALSRLKRVWRDSSLSIETKLRLLRALVLSVFLYGAESWTLNAEIEKKN